MKLALREALLSFRRAPILSALSITNDTFSGPSNNPSRLDPVLIRVTFTLRNANDYPVRDVEIACAFARRDGSHLTDRRRIIPDTVNTRSRKVYSGVLVGFVNVNANKAKCAPVAASRA